MSPGMEVQTTTKQGKVEDMTREELLELLTAAAQIGEAGWPDTVRARGDVTEWIERRMRLSIARHFPGGE